MHQGAGLFGDAVDLRRDGSVLHTPAARFYLRQYLVRLGVGHAGKTVALFQRSHPRLRGHQGFSFGFQFGNIVAGDVQALNVRVQSGNPRVDFRLRRVAFRHRRVSFFGVTGVQELLYVGQREAVLFHLFEYRLDFVFVEVFGEYRHAPVHQGFRRIGIKGVAHHAARLFDGFHHRVQVDVLVLKLVANPIKCHLPLVLRPIDRPRAARGDGTEGGNGETGIVVLLDC
ncbi:MAG: hypothetical protein LBJ59_09610 [Zoogloeaceae bacterium]|nr:hypothetical protein [Zoogloeaceae bacterium]